MDNNKASPTAIAKDASTLIGMFITLYALFLGGLAALVPFVTKEDKPRFWKTLAICLLIGACFLDLSRILDSTDDLYKSGIVGLTDYQVQDNVDDFRYYFIVNVAVIAVAILVACLPSHGSSVSRL
jgi:H+/Cl- antiporter ClcA